MVVVKFLVLGVGIYCTRYYRIGTVTNQPTPGFLTNTTTLPQAVWALPRAVASEDHSSALGASTDHLPVDWRRPRGRPRQSWLRTIEAISNRSTLDYTLHCGEQRIVLPGDASWKRLCSSSVPPDDDEPIRASD